MAQAGDLIIVNAIDRIAAGTTFKRRRNEWPLHITIMPWFDANDRDAVKKTLRRIAAETRPFEIIAGDIEYFGPDKDVPVNIVVDQAMVKALHGNVLSALKGIDVRLQEGNYIGEGYGAHITRHLDGQWLETGKQLAINNLQLIELLEDDVCHLIETFDFEVSP